MQVLLRRDVKGIGRRGDIVTVSSGHARNYLIPNGLAVEATDGAVEQATTLKRSRDLREAADRDSARTIATTLAATPLVITAKAGATGKLFGSPIRDVGTHQVTVGIYGDVRASVSVDVRGT
jgi:large subunit ribosomal protein L9